MKQLSFKHSGHAGDIIYSLASVKHICDKTGSKALYYIKINALTTIKGHPNGAVMVNMGMFNFLKPLIEAQYYIAEVLPYQGEEIDYDLDTFREGLVNLSAGNIALWYAHYYPELMPDLSHPWLDVEPMEALSKPILARTERYLNHLTFPQLAIGDAYFVGVDKEWQIATQLPNKLERLQVSNAYELANYIAAAPYVISNQTLFFAIAEGLKVTRILEQFFYAPNVIPQGGEWYTYTTQEQLKKIITIFAK
jgi:hypothetical protein